MSDAAVPQWKKDLIARLRSQNKRTAHAQQQLFGPSHRTLPPPSAVQQPVARGSEACECGGTMVQRGDKSDSDEDLHYGPGIVSKLKERYLSLAQREKPRPSILRKAASLENLLDDAPEENNRLFQPSQNRHAANRYAKKGPELKRARSVETISTPEETDTKPKRESMHEEMLIKGSLIIPEKPPPPENEYKYRVNRPKRIAPVMNEKEKPRVDIVKQNKMIFERRPEQRTKAPQQTGEVAAKVETYKRIIVENKPPKKPVVKVKPVIDKPKTNGIRVKSKPVDRETSKSPEIPPRAKSPEKKIVEVPRPKSPQTKLVELLRPKSPDPKLAGEDVPPSPKSPKSPELKLSDVPSPKSTSLPSPIPDISRVDFKLEENGGKATSLSETPDLIITSSPLPVVDSPSFRISATENFIKEEIRLAETERIPSPPPKPAKKPPPSPPSTANSMTFNFVEINKVTKTQNHLPVNKNVLNTQTPPSQPLKLEINGVNETSTAKTKKSNDLLSAKSTLTTLEIEKNLKNSAKTLQQPKSSVITKCDANEVTAIKVPKVKKSPREHENNSSMLFDFRDRKDVPDHVKNDGVKRVAKLEKPKVGEGGIILLPGASIGESFTDEDEEILRSLECPPSPCDVAFINDNILIDGKSSLSQKTKKAKLKISFVDEGPEVYEYPSESSLLVEDVTTSPQVAQIRNSIPSLSGSSSLANYTPKSTEEFQPGISRSFQNTPIAKPETPDANDLVFAEVEKPMMFSAGANSDILF